MIRRPPRSTLFPYTDALPISRRGQGERVVGASLDGLGQPEGKLARDRAGGQDQPVEGRDRKSTRLNSSHLVISYAVFCLKKKKNARERRSPGYVIIYTTPAKR